MTIASDARVAWKGPGKNEALVAENRTVNKKNRIRELYRQYVGGMEDWQIKLAIARMLHFRVPQDAWEDTMQELAIVIHEFRFDADKAHAASEKTILCRAMDNRIRMLARANARRLAMLDRLERMSQSVEDTRTPDEIVAGKELRQLLTRLTPLQQEICRALINGLGVYQIARLTNRHYTTICRHVRRIRDAFTDWGMDA